jgi:hypothetical protein
MTLAVAIRRPFGRGASSIKALRRHTKNSIRHMQKKKALCFKDANKFEDLVEWLFDKNHPHIARWVSQIAAYWEATSLEELQRLLAELDKRRQQHKARKTGITKAKI